LFVFYRLGGKIASDESGTMLKSVRSALHHREDIDSSNSTEGSTKEEEKAQRQKV